MNKDFYRKINNTYISNFFIHICDLLKLIENIKYSNTVTFRQHIIDNFNYQKFYLYNLLFYYVDNYQNKLDQKKNEICYSQAAQICVFC